MPSGRVTSSLLARCILAFLLVGSASSSRLTAQEFEAYAEGKNRGDLPVVRPGAKSGIEQIVEQWTPSLGVQPVSGYPHIMRYTTLWSGDAPPPGVTTWAIVQFAASGDGRRAQVLVIESEVDPKGTGTPPRMRHLAWIEADEYIRLRQQVLQAAAQLDEGEQALEIGVSVCSHAPSMLLEVHSGGPAQISLRSQAHCGRPKGAIAAGELLIQAAERAVGLRLRRAH